MTSTGFILAARLAGNHAATTVAMIAAMTAPRMYAGKIATGNSWSGTCPGLAVFCKGKLNRYTMREPITAPAILPAKAIASPSSVNTRNICDRFAPMLFNIPICFDFRKTETISTEAIAKDEAIRLKAEIRYADAACTVSEETKLGYSRDHERAS